MVQSRKFLQRILVIMTKISYCILIAANFLQIVPANALTSEDLQYLCSSKNETRINQCFGYIQGVIEGSTFGVAKTLRFVLDDEVVLSGEQFLNAYGEVTGFCIPSDLTGLRYIKILNEYFVENSGFHPEASVSVMDAFSRTFPCPQ